MVTSYRTDYITITSGNSNDDTSRKIQRSSDVVRSRSSDRRQNDKMTESQQAVQQPINSLRSLIHRHETNSITNRFNDSLDDMELLEIYRLPGESVGMNVIVEADSAACRRVYVDKVTPGSPADRTSPILASSSLTTTTDGLRRGDEIVEINGKNLRLVNSNEEVLRLMDEMPLRLLLLVKRTQNDSSSVPFDDNNCTALTKSLQDISTASPNFTKQTCQPSIVHEGFEVRRLAFRKRPDERLGLRVELTTVGLHKYYQIREILDGGVFSRRRVLHVGDCLLSFNGRLLEGLDKLACHQVLTNHTDDVEVEILREKPDRIRTTTTHIDDIPDISRQGQGQGQHQDQNGGISWKQTSIDMITDCPITSLTEPSELFAHNKMCLSLSKLQLKHQSQQTSDTRQTINKQDNDDISTADGMNSKQQIIPTLLISLADDDTPTEAPPLPSSLPPRLPVSGSQQIADCLLMEYNTSSFDGINTSQRLCHVTSVCKDEDSTKNNSFTETQQLLSLAIDTSTPDDAHSYHFPVSYRSVSNVTLVQPSSLQSAVHQVHCDIINTDTLTRDSVAVTNKAHQKPSSSYRQDADTQFNSSTTPISTLDYSATNSDDSFLWQAIYSTKSLILHELCKTLCSRNWIPTHRKTPRLHSLIQVGLNTKKLDLRRENIFTDDKNYHRFQQLKLYSSVIIINNDAVVIMSKLTPVTYGPFQLPRQRTASGLFQVNVLRTLACHHSDTFSGYIEGLGISINMVPDGVIITDISPAGPVGRNANVRNGDYLLAINGIDLYNIKTMSDLHDIIRHIPLGPIQLVLYARTTEQIFCDNAMLPWRSDLQDSTKQLRISTVNGPVTRIIGVNTRNMTIACELLAIETSHVREACRSVQSQPAQQSTNSDNVIKDEISYGFVRLPPDGKENGSQTHYHQPMKYIYI